MTDSYLSISSALKHASMKENIKVEIEWIDSEHLELKHDDKRYMDAWDKLKLSNGLLIPGGFGDRGIEGMILAVQWARKNNKPFFGICLGMQVCEIFLDYELLLQHYY